MSNKISLGLALVAVVIAIIALVLVLQAPKVGGGTRMTNGISADSTAPNAGQVRGTTATFTSTGNFAGNVGLASSSPFTTVGVGSSGTSTIAMQKLCMFAQKEDGQSFWIRLKPDGSTLFATSTTPCNQ